MDLVILRHLATGGFSEVPADHLATLAEWCGDWATSSGDARYSIIGETLQFIDSRYGEQGLPVELIHLVEVELRDNLLSALDCESAAEGAYFADRLRQGIHALPWTSSAWVNEGWVSRPGTDDL
jgi:hypothetical protein